MLSREQAIDLIAVHLGKSTRARHSLFVGYLMARLAEVLGEDGVLWELTGLCHDLDFQVTIDDRSRHGLITAEWLKDLLPEVALSAIRAHDHRTGLNSETGLAHALKLADGVAVGELDIGRDAMIEALSAASPADRLEVLLSARAYLPQLITRPADKLSIPLASVASLCRAAPEQ